MQSRLFVNIFLLMIAVALITFLSRQQGNDTTNPVTLTQIQPGSVNTITIVHKQRVINLEKTDQYWALTAPAQIAANNFRVNTLLKLLKTTSHSRYDANTLELENYDLLQAATTIHFDQTRIEFGMVNPVNNYRYVKVDDTVHLIDDLYYPLLSSQLGTLISLSMLDSDSRIVKLELPGMTLSLDENGLWQSSETIPTDAIVATISNWKNTQAFAVHDYFEREAIEYVRLYLDNGDEPVTFVLTDNDPWLILARPDLGIEYHLNLEAYDLLLRPGAAIALEQETNQKDVTRVSPDEFLRNLNQ